MRISNRKIDLDTICRDLDAEKKYAKEVVSDIKNVLEKLGITEADTQDISCIIDCFNFLNLTNKINKLDGIYNPYIKKDSFISGHKKIKLTFREENDKGTIVAQYENETAVTDFADYDLSTAYQLAYDIYSGLENKIYPRKNGHVPLHIKIMEAIDLINAAKSGNVYRRDIFICESMKSCFIPIDIINIGVHDGKIRKNMPFIIGYIAHKCSYSVTLAPYMIEISGANKQYLNEASLTAGDDISLRNCESLSINIINASKTEYDQFALTIRRAISCILNALALRIHADPSFDAEFLYNNFVDTVKFSDDDQWKLHQENAPEVHYDWFNKAN